MRMFLGRQRGFAQMMVFRVLTRRRRVVLTFRTDLMLPVVTVWFRRMLELSEGRYFLLIMSFVPKYATLSNHSECHHNEISNFPVGYELNLQI